jgi:very-short-patch-repair endonuclease
MYKCNKCNREFDNRYSYIGHCSSHNRGDSYKIGRSKNKEKKKAKSNCIYCNKQFDNPLKLGGHQSHCTLNPNRDETIKKLSEMNKGRKMSEEQKKKISESRKKYLNENPGNIPYLLNHSSKESYPEKIFRLELEKRKINGWEQEYPIKRYSLDFAFIDKKIDVEIDGETHNKEKVILKDIERDSILSGEGWKIIRFKSIDVKNNIDLVMNILMKELDSVA